MSQALLGCGVNDLGGTLMNESISTAAGKYVHIIYLCLVVDILGNIRTHLGYFLIPY